MNLKLKQLCIVLCSLSLLNSAFAANNALASQPLSKNTTSNDSSNSVTSENKVVLNFENADIQTVIKAISKFLHINLINLCYTILGNKAIGDFVE